MIGSQPQVCLPELGTSMTVVTLVSSSCRHRVKEHVGLVESSHVKVQNCENICEDTSAHVKVQSCENTCQGVSTVKQYNENTMQPSLTGVFEDLARYI